MGFRKNGVFFGGQDKIMQRRKKKKVIVRHLPPLYLGKQWYEGVTFDYIARWENQVWSCWPSTVLEISWMEKDHPNASARLSET